jgi:hypothetical protein
LLPIDKALGGLRLHHYHAHTVGHHIVQFAGYSGALFGDGYPRSLLALAFELGGAIL